MEPGAFSTDACKNFVRTEAHAAYSNPVLPGIYIKKHFSGDSFPPGTPPVSAAVKVIYKVTEIEKPPSRLPLGLDAIKAAKKKYAELLANAERLEPWSEGLIA